MITLEIIHEPVSWAAHQGYGNRSYNPKSKEKSFFQWQIRSQYNRNKPIGGPVRLYFSFHLSVPSSSSKIRKAQMLNGRIYPIGKKDCSNLIKFSEDCLKGIVIEDDNQVIEIVAKKLYSETPKVLIQVEVLE